MDNLYVYSGLRLSSKMMIQNLLSPMAVLLWWSKKSQVLKVRLLWRTRYCGFFGWGIQSGRGPTYITPQDSVLNRHVIKLIRNEIFVKQVEQQTLEAILLLILTTETQIPSKYKYTIHGKRCCWWIRDGNPDKYNEKQDYKQRRESLNLWFEQSCFSLHLLLLEQEIQGENSSSVDTNKQWDGMVGDNIVIKWL